MNKELTFEERLIIWNYYKDWCLEHDLEICSANIITFLEKNNFLNTKTIKIALKENKDEIHKN